MPKGQFFTAVAERMDRAIHAGYTLYPGNYAALDLLHGTHDYADRYTADDLARFEKYLAERLALIDLPEKDEPFLRQCMLTMYANPVVNHLKALQ